MFPSFSLEKSLHQIHSLLGLQGVVVGDSVVGATVVVVVVVGE